MAQSIEARNERLRAYYHRHKEFNNRKKREDTAEKKAAGLPTYHMGNYKKQRAKRLALLAELKAPPCMDCGISYPPAVMEFHHRDPATKITTVSAIAYSKIREEAAKCDLLCANCHRLRHVTY